MLLLVPLGVMAQGWPAGYGGVMLQGFFWDSFRTADGQQDKTMATMYGAGWGENDQWLVPVTTWNELLNQKDNIAPYIDLLWLPQSGATVCPDQSQFTTEGEAWRAGHNGAWVVTHYGDWINNPDCMGFVPVFYLDHGKGKTYDVNGVTWSPKSYFGTEQELINLISAYKAAGTGAVEDVVANHKGGLSTWSGVDNAADFVDEVNVTGPTTGRTYSIQWSWDQDGKCVDICSDDESGKGSGGTDCGGDAGKGTWARDVDHHSPATQQKVLTYLRYLKDELGYVGFRYDYARGFEPKHFAYYNTTIRPTFSVGEFWGSFDEITSWIKGVYNEGGFQSAAFDFPLQEVIRQAFNDETGQSFRVLETAGLIWDYRYKRYAVTFIDNHDTFKDLPTDASNSNYMHRVNHQIVEANCFLLAMPGTPCLFYPHFMHPEWHDIIARFIKARRTAGITNESAIWPSIQTGSYGIAWRITGEKGELYLQLGSESVQTGVPEGFSQVWCNTAGTCRLSITSSLAGDVDSNVKQDLVYGYPVISLGSGNYSSPVEVNVKPSTPGTVLVYTTDGNTPNAYSKQITDTAGLDLSFTATTTLKVGVLANGEVRSASIVTRDYVVDETAGDGSIKVYVKYDGGALPYIYAFDDEGNALTSAFPGWQYSSENSVVVGGVTWLHATVNASKMNIILSYGSTDSQTADINNVTSDVFYAFSDGVAYNLTTGYTQALHNPIVSIDLPSGDYTGEITPRLNASNSDAVIVYTTDGSQPTPASPSFTHSGSVTFSGQGSHVLRAGILYNGAVINQVARTYYIGDGTTLTPEEPASTGVSIYVHSADGTAPYIYSWHAPAAGAQPQSGTWPGTQMQEIKQVNGKQWYYYHFDSDTIRYIINNGAGVQGVDQRAVFAGAYFMEFDAANTAAPFENVTDDYVDYWSVYYRAATSSQPEVNQRTTIYIEGHNFYVMDNSKTYAPYLYAWTDNPSTQPFGAWPGVKMTALVNRPDVTRNYPVYYIHTDAAVDKFILNNNGSNQTSDQTVSPTGVNMCRYNPTNGIYTNEQLVNTAFRPLCEWQLKYPQFAVEQSSGGDYNGVPSCATGMGDDVYYFYFENSAPYGDPHAWVYNQTTVYTGSCWPGEALVEPVGVSPSGNIIYRWTYTGDVDVMPANVVFCDNGSPQTADFDFVNGGYYNADGLVGVVSNKLLTLAELLRFGTIGEDYIIADDLTGVWINETGEWLWAKDDNGDANNPSYNTRGLPVPKVTRDVDYDQSNWAQLVLKDPVATVEEMSALQGRTLLGQTVLGTLVDRTNPTIQLRANPIPTDVAPYVPNTFYPANFVEQESYFMVQPKPQEYVNIMWAICREKIDDNTFVFVIPKNDSVIVNNEGVPGAMRVYVKDGYWENFAGFNGDMIKVNYEYNDVKAIVKAVTPAMSVKGNGVLPDDATHSPVSTLWEAYLISVGESNPIETAITPVMASAQPVSVEYYNMMGVKASVPFDGFNVVVTLYDDGSSTVEKKLYR